jgi:hypothetical protein
MRKLLKLMLASAIVLGLSSTAVFAGNAVKGQKLMIKKLKEPCGMDGAKMAGQHTQDEWESIQDSGKLAEEIQNICGGKAPAGALKDKFMDHYYEFFYKYASDSGNVPSC